MSGRGKDEGGMRNPLQIVTPICKASHQISEYQFPNKHLAWHHRYMGMTKLTQSQVQSCDKPRPLRFKGQT